MVALELSYEAITCASYERVQLSSKLWAKSKRELRLKGMLAKPDIIINVVR